MMSSLNHFLQHSEKSISACFLQKCKDYHRMVKVFQNKFSLIFNQKENCHHDHIPFSLRGITIDFSDLSIGNSSNNGIFISWNRGRYPERNRLLRHLLN